MLKGTYQNKSFRDPLGRLDCEGTLGDYGGLGVLRETRSSRMGDILKPSLSFRTVLEGSSLDFM